MVRNIPTKLESYEAKISITEKPPKGCHVNVLQIKKPTGQNWSFDGVGDSWPFYFEPHNIKNYMTVEEGQDILMHTDGATGTGSFYMMPVEVCKCLPRNSGQFRSLDDNNTSVYVRILINNCIERTNLRSI